MGDEKVLKDECIFVEWKVYKGEGFHIGNYSFDIDEAKKILIKAPRPSGELQMESLGNLPGFIVCEPSDREVNLDVPIIIAQFDIDDKSAPTQVMPIDGWGRINKALADDIQRLPCVLLTKAETKRIMR